MGYRVERVNSEMAKSIANTICNKLKDPRVSEMVSVTSVNVAKDLKTAKVYVSIYGDKEKVDSTFEGLARCAGFIRKELAADFKDIRSVPELTFIEDTSLAYSDNIDRLIEKIRKSEKSKDEPKTDDTL